MEKQFHQKPLSNPELSEFFSQLSMLLHSGISIPEALNLLLADACNEAERALLSLMLDTAEVTGQLYPAAEASGVFPVYALSMIHLGEETGTLDDILEALAGHYIREANFRQMFRNALIYPGIMLSMMAVVILVLLTKVMPIFNQVFIQLGQEMTGISAGLLHIGETLSTYSVLAVALLLLILVLLSVFRSRLPFIRRIREKISECRFAEGVGIALKSGMTPEQSLTLAASLTEDEDFNRRILDCQDRLSEGMEFSEALTGSGILSGSHARMAYIAGKSGRMEEAMEHISEDCEFMVNARITGLIAALEPTLVVLLSLIVGIILFSVMLPLMGIMSGL